MIGKKIVTGPQLTLHGGWQIVPLDSARAYAPKVLYLAATTSSIIYFSTDASNAFALPAGEMLKLTLDGAPMAVSKGSELVTAGNFSQATGWTAPTGWDIAGGKAHHNTGNVGVLKQTIAVEDDGLYEVKYDIITATGGTGSVTPSLGGVSMVGRTGAVTQATEVIQAVNSTGPLRFTPTSALHRTLDNVSVKKLSLVSGSNILFCKGTAGVILSIMFTL